MFCPWKTLVNTSNQCCGFLGSYEEWVDKNGHPVSSLSAVLLGEPIRVYVMENRRRVIASNHLILVFLFSWFLQQTLRYKVDAIPPVAEPVDSESVTEAEGWKIRAFSNRSDFARRHFPIQMYYWNFLSAISLYLKNCFFS